jgi:glycosyltransferase involved in cell wall biosynthesis
MPHEPNSGQAASSAPSLSVVIPLHNGESTIAQQLNAVLASITDDMEVIVINNRSTDRSLSIVERIAHCDERVRLVTANDRAGEPHARNVGLQAASSNLIAYCDADDVVVPSWAPAMRAALSRAEFVTGPVELDLLNPPWLAEVRGRGIFESIPTTSLGIPFAHGCNIGLRRDAAQRIGGFDESVRIGADIDFAVRAFQAGIDLAWAPDAAVHYRHRLKRRDRWRQAVSYGRAAHHLHDLAGEPWGLGVRARQQLRRFGWLLANCHRVHDRGLRTKWAWTLALALGEIRGKER